MEDRGSEGSVGGMLSGERIRKAESGVSGLVTWVKGYRGGESVESVPDKKREASAKRWRFWRMRTSQSTSSSKMRAVARFCSTTLQGVNSLTQTSH